MHGFALALIALTVSLFTVTLALAAVGFISYMASTLAAIIWEKWELLSSTTTCNPALFSDVQHVCSEMLRLINDTVDDELIGVIFLLITLAFLLLADQHFGYEYVGT
jgi:hypothetical protein